MILYHHVTHRRDIIFEELKENLNYFFFKFDKEVLKVIQ